MGLDDDAVAAVPKIRELRGKIATGTSDPTALSHEIFSHLATFFSRYYQDGDFNSLRRYKKDTYAIPYGTAQTFPVIDSSLSVSSFHPEAVIIRRSFARVMP